jgi:hypothetical protein
MQLLREGKKEEALKLVQKAETEIPCTTVPHNWHSGSPDLARIWLTLGKTKKAEEIAEKLGTMACEYLDWYIQLPIRYAKASLGEMRYYYYQLSEVQELLSAANSPLAKKYEDALQRYYQPMAFALDR